MQSKSLLFPHKKKSGLITEGHNCGRWSFSFSGLLGEANEPIRQPYGRGGGAIVRAISDNFRPSSSCGWTMRTLRGHATGVILGKIPPSPFCRGGGERSTTQVAGVSAIPPSAYSLPKSESILRHPVRPRSREEEKARPIPVGSLRGGGGRAVWARGRVRSLFCRLLLRDFRLFPT